MVSDALWKVFEVTGHIGAYLLYKDYQDHDREALESREKCRKWASGQGEIT